MFNTRPKVSTLHCAQTAHGVKLPGGLPHTAVMGFVSIIIYLENLKLSLSGVKVVSTDFSVSTAPTAADTDRGPETHNFLPQQ